ncbi:MAG: ATP synthase F1 subunit delta [Bacteroidetes bacterium]|nr:MAG: ATP synthase F1 subunit delta [Bacteroidota bacterium]UCE70091.1 MAG: ATP synthase F1 subunit delta [Flavobacteriaceae bacterium]
MSEHRAAYRYAKALMGLAVEQDKVREIERDMHFILDTIQGSDPLKDVLHSPVITDQDKASALKVLFKNVQPLSSELFNLLAANKRVDILKEVGEQFVALYDKMRGQDIALVTTAVPLNSDLEKKILKQLQSITGREVVIENEIDPELIGGFILRIGDLEYNASISSKLENLKRELIKK